MGCTLRGYGDVGEHRKRKGWPAAEGRKPARTGGFRRLAGGATIDGTSANAVELLPSIKSLAAE
jgi:hypothetical protein